MYSLITLPFAFRYLRFRDCASDTQVSRLRDCMATPPHTYHTEAHIRAVLSCVWAWTKEAPSAPLVAAALYHDAVYDATRTDNEARSADFCRAELARMETTADVIDAATRLIYATAHHVPAPDDADETLLLDADLHISGESPEAYAAYVKGVRAEYAHVPPGAWQTGRGRVLESFLARPRIYHGDWASVREREAAARRNLQAERNALNPAP